MRSLLWGWRSQTGARAQRARLKTAPPSRRLKAATLTQGRERGYLYCAMAEVKKRRKGFTRLSTKHQATIPVQALKDAGLKPGDVLRVVAAGQGRLVLERDVDVVGRHAGSLPGVYAPDELDALRDEWR